MVGPIIFPPDNKLLPEKTTEEHLPSPNWGGFRPGAGRKPKPLTLLKRAAMSQIENDAAYALRLYVEVMREEEYDIHLRLDAAREVMDRTWGKPAQVTRSAARDEYKEYLDKIAKAVNESGLERLELGGAPPGQTG